MRRIKHTSNQRLIFRSHEIRGLVFTSSDELPVTGSSVRGLRTGAKLTSSLMAASWGASSSCSRTSLLAWHLITRPWSHRDAVRWMKEEVT